MRSSKIKLHTDRALEAPNTMTHRNRWRFGVLASAVALLGSFSSIEAHALALGRVTVQSALGEALRAEVDIAEITAEEAGSLRVAVGSAAAFKAAGLEYSAAVVSLQVSLQKRVDGRSFLRLSSPRPVTEPFVDLVLEANWASGRVVRDYTLLFDPPNLRQAIGPTSVPSISGGATPRASRPATQTAPSTAISEPAAPRDVKPVPMTKAARQKAEAPQKAPGAPGALGSGQQVTVKSGDTASKIAGQNKPAGISLDQMLVALLNSNPDAFIGGNINRLKSGALLDLPTEETAGATSAADATRTITAQAKDFNNFRRKLAEGAPTAQVAAADRQAGGKLQAKVEDSVASAKTPDKLTLSKGAVQSKSPAEEKIAKDRQALAESTRVAELSKNIGDLKKLTGTPTAAISAAAPAAASSAAKVPSVAVPAPAAIPAIPAAPAPAAITASAAKSAVVAPAAVPAVVAAAPAAAVPASALTPATTPALIPALTPASTPALPAASVPAMATSTAATSVSATVAAGGSATVATAAASAPAAVPASAAASLPMPVAAKKVAPPPPVPTLIESLTDSPFALPALGGLLALLAGFGYYRYKKKDSLTAVDSSFLESRLQPDSFFGASGGQRVDTSESSAAGSSLVYSPSQLDAAGDVDPVAEADVYLAYGRDLQAEEILKEALRTTPTRVAIHSKLCEIYAKRRDIKGFESLANDAFELTKGEGPEWSYISELGRDLDPANAFYKPGGQPLVASASLGAAAADFGHDTMPVSRATNLAGLGSVDAPDDVDFDLDLDFSAEQPPAAAPASRTISAAAPAPAATPTATAFRPEPGAGLNPNPVPAFDSGSMDFDDVKVATQPMAIKAAATDASYAKTQPLVSIKPASAAPAAVLDSGMLEFDMSSLSPGLGASSGFGPIAAPPAAAFVPQGPLETKFALAEEFRLLGDPDGARSLANEVVTQAHGALKTKAQAFLNSLT